MKQSISLFLGAALLILQSAVFAQVRQTALYIDNGSGAFTKLIAPGSGGTVTIPSSGTLMTSGNAVLFNQSAIQNTGATTPGKYLFDLGYDPTVATGGVAGALITSTATSGTATGLTVNATATTGASTGLSVSATGGSTNNAIAVTGGNIEPSVGQGTLGHGIEWPNNPGGGGGDRAWLQYWVLSGEDTKFQIGTDNDATDVLSLYQMGADRLILTDGYLSIGGDVHMNGHAIDSAGTITSGEPYSTSPGVTGELDLANASSTYVTKLQAGNATSSVTYILPTADGSSGSVLSTNGSGTLSWATGGTAAYGYVYDLSGSGQTVTGGSDVLFSNNGPLSGMSHTATTSSVSITSAGVYKIDYKVNVSTTTTGVPVAIAVNGTVDASTVTKFLLSTEEITGSCILSLSAGDVITLRNDGAASFTTASSPDAAAALTILKLH